MLKSKFSQPYFWLITAVSVIVPKRLRAAWKQEWEAELCHHESRLTRWRKLDWLTRIDLLRRSLGSLKDALILQPLRWEDDMWQDLRFGIRMLLKKPGFTAAALIALALGIGANTAIFSVINGVFLNPLAYHEPERLMMIWEKLTRADQVELSPQDYEEYVKRNQVFAHIGAAEGANFNLTGGSEPVHVDGQAATASLFPLLGVNPLLGRTFTKEEDDADAPVVVLSHRLWQSHFAGNPAILNQTIRLNDKNYTVIGVMPPEFQYPPPVRQTPTVSDLWVPRALMTEKARNSHNLKTIGRLKDGVTYEQARAALELSMKQRQQENPKDHDGISTNPIPLPVQVGSQIRLAVQVFAAAVMFVLLIACANVANLLLSFAAARQKEFALRSALGAGRFRIVRQLLTESVLLALLGGGLGLLLANGMLKAFRIFGAGQIPRLDQISLDGRVLMFSAALSLLTGIVFGLAPAWHAARTDLNQTLKEGGRRASGSGSQRLRNSLIVAEVALSLILLVGAGLLMKSFWRMQQVDPGFNPDNLLTFEIQLPYPKYEDAQRRENFAQATMDRLSALPGVEATAFISHVPFGSGQGLNGYKIEGRPEPQRSSDAILAGRRIITGEYFRAMGIPLLEGRTFNAADGDAAPRVAVISQTFATRFFPNENPIGRRLQTNNEWFTIVGVAGEVRHIGLDAELIPQVYFNFAQGGQFRTRLVLRTKNDPLSNVNAVRQQIQAVDRDLPIYEVFSMNELIAKTIASRRFNLLLLGVFAIVALLLAAVGIYGVMSYATAQRTNEIGIRMALGASRSAVYQLILGQGMRVVAIGLLTGLIGAFALTRWMETLLFEVRATDPMTYVVIAFVLAGIALVACFVPARRATKTDPMIALRYE
ncbi:MAG: ABC transporter permease [Blastocatellia bacterium]|nr:ABC transporter permease [Blastocatellia bacterium]